MIPNIKAYWLTGFRQNKKTKSYEPTIDKVFEKARETRCHGIDVQANREVVDANFVKRLRAENSSSHIWTVNDPADARHFRKLGVDSITTDRPGYLRSELKRK